MEVQAEGITKTRDEDGGRYYALLVRCSCLVSGFAVRTSFRWRDGDETEQHVDVYGPESRRPSRIERHQVGYGRIINGVRLEVSSVLWCVCYEYPGLY